MNRNLWRAQLSKKLKAFLVTIAMVFGLGVTTAVVATPAAADDASTINSAVDWAMARNGQHVYDGLCLPFVHDAYSSAGYNIGTGYANPVNYWNGHGGHQSGENAPKGALVFWGANQYNSDGHVALSLGGGMVISTYERSNHNVHTFAIADRNNAGYRSTYLGWMMPPGMAVPGSGGTTPPPPTPPQNPSYLGLARNADGRVEAFAVGTNNTIYPTVQSAANSDNWDPWFSLPSGAKSATAVSQADGRLSVFYIGGDNSLYYQTQLSPNSQSWSGEHHIGANLLAPLSVARNADGRLQVFSVGTDNRIYSMVQSSPNSDTWNPWFSIPAGAKSVSAVAQADGRLSVFYIGLDGALWYQTEDSVNSTNSWSGGEHRVDATLTGGVSASQRSDGKIEVFAIGTNQKIYSMVQSAANSDNWDPWFLIPSGASSIASTVQQDGSIMLAYIGLDGAFWYQKEGNWGSEYRIGANLHL